MSVQGVIAIGDDRHVNLVWPTGGLRVHGLTVHNYGAAYRR